MHFNGTRLSIPCRPPATFQQCRRRQSCCTYVRPFLHDCPDDLVSSAVLLTSELVTNAIIHAHTAFQLELTSPDANVLIAITDDTQNLPTLESHDSLDEHGRGIPTGRLPGRRMGR